MKNIIERAFAGAVLGLAMITVPMSAGGSRTSKPPGAKALMMSGRNFVVTGAVIPRARCPLPAGNRCRGRDLRAR